MAALTDPPHEGDRVEKLDWAERWFADGFAVCARPGGAISVEIDMSTAAALLDRCKLSGVKVSYSHVVVRAAALALARHPEVHMLVAGRRRLHPQRVDVGLSVAGQTSFAPVMILEDAGNKRLGALAGEIVRRIPSVRDKETRDLDGMRSRGWLIPFRWLRRRLLGWLYGQLWFRRKLAGTFQVTCVPGCDFVVPLVLGASLCLGVGGVKDRVIASDGKPVVRPTVIVVVSFDHAAWDGARATTFLAELRRILEAGELDAEVDLLSVAAPAA